MSVPVHLLKTFVFLSVLNPHHLTPIFYSARGDVMVVSGRAGRSTVLGRWVVAGLRPPLAPHATAYGAGTPVAPLAPIAIHC